MIPLMLALVAVAIVPASIEGQEPGAEVTRRDSVAVHGAVYEYLADRLSPGGTVLVLPEPLSETELQAELVAEARRSFERDVGIGARSDHMVCEEGRCELAPGVANMLELRAFRVLGEGRVDVTLFLTRRTTSAGGGEHVEARGWRLEMGRNEDGAWEVRRVAEEIVQAPTGTVFALRGRAPRPQAGHGPSSNVHTTPYSRFSTTRSSPWRVCAPPLTGYPSVGPSRSPTSRGARCGI